jgi:hypothetical protein
VTNLFPAEYTMKAKTLNSSFYAAIVEQTIWQVVGNFVQDLEMLRTDHIYLPTDGAAVRVRRDLRRYLGSPPVPTQRPLRLCLDRADRALRVDPNARHC